MTIHIPDEVIEPIAKEIYDALPYDCKGEKPAWVPRGNNIKQEDCRVKARAAITAALQAWLGTGMAKSGFGYPFAEDRSDNWLADSHLCKEDLTDFNDTFPVLIIRTEAPRT
jgi:hypothetical protein